MTEAKPDTEHSIAGIAGRGVLMGLAEVVPGVSGGTVAFITGIYAQLVAALASFGPRSLTLLTQPLAFFQHHNLRFLLSLALGMGIGILAFAQVMSYLLDHHAHLVWGFFSGVIAVSAWVLGRSRPRSTLLWALPLGLVFGVALLLIPANQGTPGLLSIFIGGAIAVCAWLLPAVSGSYMLLTLGLYEPVIDAVAEFHWVILVTLAAGCATGLLLFVRLLNWLLTRYEDGLMSVLTGFMLGSLLNLWPWQHAGQRLWPSDFSAASGEPAQLLGVGLCVVLGGVLLWLLAKITRS